MLGSWLLFFAAITIHAQPSEFPKLTGPYLGQTPPGRTAVPFAPDIIKNPHESPIMTPDGTGMIVGFMEEGWKYFKLTDGVWKIAPKWPFEISGIVNGMSVTPSWNRIYFLLWEGSKEDFWFIERSGDGWTNPQKLPDQINSFQTHWQFSVTDKGSLYFASQGKILVSRSSENRHVKPEPLKLAGGGELNGGTPFVAPDETFLIASSGSSRASGDLFICYRTNKGEWSVPQNLGAIIHAPSGTNICPKITPDKKFMFFLNLPPGSSKIYWVESGFIEELKPKK